jgi:iron complex outermembrane recepter protein
VTRAANLREFSQKVRSVNYDAVVEFDTGPAQHKVLVYGEAAETRRDADIFSATYVPINLMAPVYFFPNTAPQRGPWIVSSRNHFETFGYALAVQDNISFWQDKLILVAGARYDYAINDTFSKVTNRYTRSDDARDGITQKWAAVYRPKDYLTLYYNYSETFQPTSTNIGGMTLPNVESTNNEFGVKVALPEGRFSATASYFHIETDNLIINVPVTISQTGAITTMALPVGLRVVKGWELDFTSNLGKGLSLLGGIGRLKSRTEQGLRARGVADGLNYRVFGRWTLPLNTVGKWYVGVGYEHTGIRPLDTLDTYLLPEMDLVDAVVGWRHRGVTLQANIGNVFDKIVPRAGTTRADIMPTDPRSVRFSARWTF